MLTHNNTSHPTTPPSLMELQRLIKQKWPAAITTTSDRLSLIYKTGIPSLDNLFPRQGIPCGQLLEITGPPSSGKTTLLFMFLAALAKSERIVYIDLSRSFFPAAAVSCGVDIKQLLVVNPENAAVGLRLAELLLRYDISSCVVFDLIGRQQKIPLIMLHRLRLKTTRAKGLAIFLTENNSDIIPSSMVSLRLAILRKNETTMTVTVAKSRISKEGTTVEVTRHA